MNQKLRKEANQIIAEVLASVKPDAAVKRAMRNITFSKHVYVVAIGKAAWQMAAAAVTFFKEHDISYEKGVALTKYHHVMGSLPRITCVEAGHPVPDENSFRGTEEVLSMVQNLTEEDMVLFLVSGGGSALFEKPKISGEELSDITEQLLASGADIVEMNTIRKRLSQVKGGRFAQACMPAMVETIVLSDILGDPLDMIASGPAYPDASTCKDAGNIAKKYNLRLGSEAKACLLQETPKELANVHTQIIGSVRQLCRAAQLSCEALGYETIVLANDVTEEARKVGVELAKQVLLQNEICAAEDEKKKVAIIAGGETVVHLQGKGLGGRNQELAFSAMKEIAGQPDIAIFSVGSDGTDGPTDAAGGYVDGDSYEALKHAGLSYEKILQDNDCYHGLEAIEGLVVTGPTGTNVNDFWIALYQGEA